MGDPVKPRKKYSKPKHPYEKDRILEENELVEKYGLKNKREIWKADSTITNYRMQARTLLGDKSIHRGKKERELILKLYKLGLLGESGTLDNILSFKTDDLLNRRLQTLVYRKGLAMSAKQARQFIVHGHVAIRGRRIDSPSYIVKRDEENEIGYYEGKIPSILSEEQRQLPVALESHQQQKDGRVVGTDGEELKKRGGEFIR